MDVYSSYNQIRMNPLDEEKMTFITENANYGYKVILFGLKNVEATYQKLMNEVYPNQIGRIMQVYMDDMVAKTMEDGDHCKDVRDIFC